MSDFPSCTHTPQRVGRFEVVACPTCQVVDWYQDGRPIDPDTGMAGLFGDFDLVASLPGVHAPGEEVLLYRPPRAGRHRSFQPFEAHVWYRATEHLWLSHDTELLVLAPTNPLITRNLTRGA